MSNETNPAAGLSYNTERGPTDADAVLVKRSAKGDLDAFEQLVHKHQKKMLNLAYRIIGDYEEACEAVQDAFVSAYKNIKTFRGDAKFSTWLTTITLNQARNRLKQYRSRERHIAYSLDAPIETDQGAINAEPPSKEPTVLDRLEARDIRKRVDECIHRLEPDYREVIVLRDLQDFSYEEIGGVLKIREGTVKSRLFRAREAVKECLKEAMGIL
jgi:RNA polymerase sigma-70 factor (ECF subfamily)